MKPTPVLENLLDYSINESSKKEKEYMEKKRQMG
jgi:hypothetical protein